MRLYLLVLASKADPEKITELLSSHNNYHRLDENIIGVLDEVDSYERMITIRDEVTAFFGNRVHVIVFRIQGDEFAWLLTNDGSSWLKQNLCYGKRQ